MCVGFPMTVVEDFGAEALCERHGARERVSMLLVGPQPAGTQILAHLGAAVRVLSDLEARQIDDALCALEAALRGENVDRFFADLVDRAPELPAFLRGEPLERAGGGVGDAEPRTAFDGTAP